MKQTMKRLAQGAFIAASFAMVAGPALAQMPPPPPGAPPGGPPQQEQPRKKRHHGDVGAGIAAGVLGGIAGAAIVGSQRQADPGYGYGVADEEPDCRIVRKPVYDEDGEVVSYRNRRVCN